MNIYLSHSRNSDYLNELYKPFRESSLNTNHKIVLPHEGGQMINTRQIIEKSDLVIAEVSSHATGQGIELGWANASGVRILCVYKKGSEISGSLRYITQDFIEYENPDDLLKKLADFIVELVD